MQPPVTPVALDYLASALNQNSFKIDILDLCFSLDYQAAIRGYFYRRDAFAVAVTFRNVDDSSLATQRSFLPKLKEIIGCLRECTTTPLILGGGGFSVLPEAILAYCNLDIGIWGEGEFALPLLLTRVARGEGFYDVPGLVYRTGDGFRRNAPHYIELERMGAPHRITVDNRRYFREGGMGCLETKRGCPKSCIYCVDPVSKGRNVRLRSPLSVIAEIKELFNQGIDHLHLCDSEFNIPESHAKAVCAEIIAHGLGDRVRWYTYASPVPFSEELALLMKEAGCVGINFGVDSGCDRMLRILGRDFSVQDLRETARICRQADLICMYDLLLGGPGETRDSLRETIENMKRISPDRVGAAMGVRVYPGTRLGEMVHDEGPLDGNPNLHGYKSGNDNLGLPIFFLSHDLGEAAAFYLTEIVNGDERFFLHTPEAGDKNYNYDNNMVLVNAIHSGYRGAFWDILRRLPTGGK